MKKYNIQISQRLVDHTIAAILIFTSVFFAFWLTEYRETKKNEKTLKISLQHIASEMKYNHYRVEAIYEYHTKLIKSIDSIKDQLDTNWEELDGKVLKIWSGIQLPALRSTAYKTFLNSNINDIAEFELVKSLADIYNIQSIVERLDNSIFEIVVSDKQLTSLQKIRHLAEIYTGILPDVMIQYQYGQQQWFHKHGYNDTVNNTGLQQIIQKRLQNN